MKELRHSKTRSLKPEVEGREAPSKRLQTLCGHLEALVLAAMGAGFGFRV